jgi:uncharacterized protein (DUF427 family)
MSLTMGTGPFGHVPAGRFNVELDHERVVYSEPSPRRIRALRAGETVLDTRRAAVVHQHGRLARYYYPRDDVRWELLADVEPVSPPAAAGLDGHVAIPWSAMDKWLEEDDEIVGHAPDPYHRIDVRNSSRPVRVSLDGVLLAESRRARVLFETSLPPRWYLPPEDVVAELEPSDLRTTCAYKGHARYHSVAGAENLFWHYDEPRHDALPVKGLLAFFNEQVDLELDGELQPRPGGPWAQPGWWRAERPEV